MMIMGVIMIDDKDDEIDIWLLKKMTITDHDNANYCDQNHDDDDADVSFMTVSIYTIPGSTFF